jgi:glyoxylase-like metal-dependent hydrolase (beta-lactamase superfamily II)
MPRIYNLEEYAVKLRKVHLIVGEGLCSNIYVIGRDTAFIIDTGVGNNVNPVWPQLEELNVGPEKLNGVVLTHAHHDHAMGVYIILQKAEPKIFVHKHDSQHIASRLGSHLIKVKEGDIIKTELCPLKVIWTPGHTEGGMCLYNEDKKILFSGDTVFPGGNYGNYRGESGGLTAMIDSLRKLVELEVDVMMPGHGSPVFEDADEHIRLSYENASQRP